MDRQKNEPSWYDRAIRWIAQFDSVFGSDVYVSYTHAYVWQANQFGHMFIGLCGTLVLMWILSGSITAFLILIVIYGVKELIDFLIASRLQEGVFPVDVREAAADGAVDWAFVTLGGLTAATVVAQFDLTPWGSIGSPAIGVDAWWDRLDAMLGGWDALVGILAPVIFFFVVRSPYLRQKRAFDKSGLPYLVRLPTFPNNFELNGSTLDGLQRTILAFARTDGKNRHMVIAGPPRSGRTTLAASIGSEATSRNSKVRYVVASRLAEKSALPCERPSAPAQPYQVAEADLIIVDELSRQILPDRDDSAMRKALGALVDARVGDLKTTVFQRPTCLVSGGKSSNREPRELPAVIWVATDAAHGQRLANALSRKFGSEIALVLLADELKRTMRLDQ